MVGSSIPKTLAGRVRLLRGERTKEAIARASGLSVKTIYRIERDESHKLSSETLDKLCTALSCSMDFLARGKSAA